MKNNPLNMFPDEELDRMSGSLFAEEPIEEKRDEKVTVLGMTFDSDEARREYFREELRKKLPELRKMEGFPIGSDDDIVNLSDPPYYTSCPNPWLNDIIAEWETKKKELERQGLRKSDFEVGEPYAMDVEVSKSNPIYKAHTYHTKVPHPAIMRYLLHYTQPGDTVFDGFAGTGMTGVASTACGKPREEDKMSIESEWQSLFGNLPVWGERHVICGDLSPYASYIAFNYNTPVDIQLFNKEAKRILEEMEGECKWMYTTLHEGKEIGIINYSVWSDVLICKNCGKEFVYWDVALDRDNKCLRDKFYCPHCNTVHTKKDAQRFFETRFDKELGDTVSINNTVPVLVEYSVGKKRYEKPADEYDRKLIEKIANFDIKTFVPLTLLPKGFNTNQPIKAQNIRYVHQFFTRRNLIALSILYDKIERSALPLKLKFIFTGMINRSTKMNRVHINNYFYGGGGWNAGHLKGTLYIPSSPVETSIIEQIDDKIKGYTSAYPFLPKKYDNCVYVGSANKTNIADNSIDYIFTDPPFGSNIMYSELNFLPEAWFKVFTNNGLEAIVNEVQEKDTIFYLNMMSRCFEEYYRILKPSKWMTVEFSNTSACIWNSIQQALVRSGFVIANVAALNKGQGGMRSITSTTAVKQDLAISCYKPSIDVQNGIGNVMAKNVWNFVEEHLEHLPVCIINENVLTTVVERDKRILYDRVVSYYVQKGITVPMDTHEFQRGLSERFVERDGMYFTATQVTEYDEKKKTALEFVPMGIVVNNEAEGIAWLQNQLRETPKTYSEIQPDWLQAIHGIRRYDILPELKQLLEENFIEEKDGKWRLPNIQDDVDVDALRTKALLREFKVYVEASLKPKARIKEARVEALRAGFKQCYINKDFATIVLVCDHIPPSLRDEDEVLLQYYDIALNKMD